MDCETSKIHGENKWKNGNFDQMVNSNQMNVSKGIEDVEEVDWS